jgi:hypothetical protein
MGNFTYDALLETDALVKKNNRFLSPKELVHGFIDIVGTSEMFKTSGSKFMEVDVSDEITLRSTLDSDSQLITYQKGMVRMLSNVDLGTLYDTSRFPQSSYTVGIIWAYTGKIPIIKVFRGSNVMACMNLLIIGADDITTIKLKPIPGDGIDRKNSVIWNRNIEDAIIELEYIGERYLAESNNHVTDLVTFQNKLYDTVLDEQSIREIIADLVIANYELNLINSYTFSFGLSAMLDPNQPNKIYQLYNLKEEGNNRLWNVYNAFTQHLSSHKTEIDSKPEKTLGITTLIRLVSGDTTVEEIKKSKN